MRILIVKTSSLGDLVHNFPALSDIRAHRPDATIDWAVEEALVDLPCLHPAVDEIVSVATRRWQRQFLRPSTWHEVRSLRQHFERRQYDLVIDTQGLLKSAAIARLAPGIRVGLDFHSAREPLWPFYHRTLRVHWKQHAVERNRQIAAQALGYVPTSSPRYGIRIPAMPHSTPAPVLSKQMSPADAARLARLPHAVLLHATSERSKLWAEGNWVALGRELERLGMVCVLPWGTAFERARAERLARSLSRAIVPNRLSLSEAAELLGTARLVVGVDTGLAHLAAALGTPTVGIYAATDPDATGLYGAPHIANVGGTARPPAARDVMAAAQGLLDAQGVRA